MVLEPNTDKQYGRAQYAMAIRKGAIRTLITADCSTELLVIWESTVL